MRWRRFCLVPSSKRVKLHCESIFCLGGERERSEGDGERDRGEGRGREGGREREGRGRERGRERGRGKREGEGERGEREREKREREERERDGLVGNILFNQLWTCTPPHHTPASSAATKWRLCEEWASTGICLDSTSLPRGWTLTLCQRCFLIRYMHTQKVCNILNIYSHH